MQKKGFILEKHGPIIFSVIAVVLTIVNMVIGQVTLKENQVHQGEESISAKINTMKQEIVEYSEKSFFSKSEGVEIKTDIVYIKKTLDMLQKAQEAMNSNNRELITLLQQNLKKP